MGFPVGYTELPFPKLLLHVLSLLALLRALLCGLLRFMGLHHFLEPDANGNQAQFQSLLPVLSFRDLAEPPESCAVCLTDFHQNDHIRRLPNCPHIFHRGCLDRWMRYDQRTCPLCRTPFVPDHIPFIHILSRIPQLYAEYPHLPAF